MVPEESSAATAAAFRADVTMRRVCIVQTQLPHYRVALFERLRDSLRQRGVDLRLIHGRGDPEKLGRADGGTVSWATVVDNRRPLGALCPLLWQPLGRYLKACELVIVTQENRLLQNYWLLLRRRSRRQMVAFWGHGRNFQARSSWREKLRRWQVRQPDWWFAYTDSSAHAVIDSGFPAGRITVLENAVDTATLRRELSEVTVSEVRKFGAEIGIRAGPVGVFCSSLHAGKRIDFLLTAAAQIRARHPGFQLLVVGTGPEAHRIEKARGESDWIHWVGPRFGREKAICLRLGTVFLMPYFVGLSILDAFCAGLPLIAVRVPEGDHSPEIEYLDDNRNGLLTKPSPEAFADGVTELLNDNSRLEHMAAQAVLNGGHYTIERMVRNFHDGIVAALAAGGR